MNARELFDETNLLVPSDIFLAAYPLAHILPASSGLYFDGNAQAQFAAGSAQSPMTTYPGDHGGIHILSEQLRLAPRATVNSVTGNHSGARTPMPAIHSSGSLAAGALVATATSERTI